MKRPPIVPLLALVTACSGSDTETSAGASTTDATTTTMSESTTDASTTDASTTATSTDASTSTSTTTETTTAGGECVDDMDCANGEVCVGHDDGMCGPITRACEMYPATCGEHPFTTACGCDGKTFVRSPCYLDAGIDTRDGACPPDPGAFWCGEGSCVAGDELCHETIDGVACEALPDGCDACACLDAGLTECGCVDEPGGGVRVLGCSI